MIDTHQSRQLDGRRLWSGHVRRLLRTINVDEHVSAADITESLAVFCQRHEYVPEHSLFLLIARSFCAAGDADAAGLVLRNNHAYRPHTESWLEVLSAGYPFPELYPLFSSRALRPQSLASAGTLWVLDFDKVRLTDADRHELILFQTARVLAEKISSVWKRSAGQGTLGIKGLERLTRSAGRHTAQRLSGHIRDVLARCARKNGWTDVPDVLLLDL